MCNASVRWLVVVEFYVPVKSLDRVRLISSVSMRQLFPVFRFVLVMPQSIDFLLRRGMSNRNNLCPGLNLGSRGLAYGSQK